MLVPEKLSASSFTLGYVTLGLFLFLEREIEI